MRDETSLTQARNGTVFSRKRVDSVISTSSPEVVEHA